MPDVVDQPWTRRVESMVGLDLETTGVDPHADRIVTASIVTIVPGRPPDVSEWLVDPGIDIPESATAIHGVTTERVRAEGVDPAVAVDAIATHLRRLATLTAGDRPTPLVVFNAPFDLTTLIVECARHGVELPPIGPVVDPLVLDYHVDRYRPGRRTLGALAAEYGVALDDAHRSTGDTLAALRLTWAMARRASLAEAALTRLYTERRHPLTIVRDWRRIGSMSLGYLHDAQVGWYATRADSYRQYLVGRGEADQAAMVRSGWPIDRRTS